MGGRELEKRTWLHFDITRPKKKGFFFFFREEDGKMSCRPSLHSDGRMLERGCAHSGLQTAQGSEPGPGKEETRSSRLVVWFMKTLKKRVAGLRICWPVLCQQTESHSGCEELLEHFHQPCLGLGHPILLQGLQQSALAHRKPLLHFRETSSSS